MLNILGIIAIGISIYLVIGLIIFIMVAILGLHQLDPTEIRKRSSESPKNGMLLIILIWPVMTIIMVRATYHGNTFFEELDAMILGVQQANQEKREMAEQRFAEKFCLEVTKNTPKQKMTASTEISLHREISREVKFDTDYRDTHKVFMEVSYSGDKRIVGLILFHDHLWKVFRTTDDKTEIQAYLQQSFNVMEVERAFLWLLQDDVWISLSTPGLEGIRDSICFFHSEPPTEKNSD